MRSEPGVMHFPGTDGVLTVCTTNQTILWCLESRLGLAKNRKLRLDARIDWNGKDIQARLNTFLSLENIDGAELLFIDLLIIKKV